MSELLPEEELDDWTELQAALVDADALEALAALGRIRDRREQLSTSFDECQELAVQIANEVQTAEARIEGLEEELEDAQGLLRAQNVRLAEMELILGNIASLNPKNRDRAKTLGEASVMARRALGKK